MTFTSHDVLATTIPVFFIVAIGYLVRRTRIVNDDSERSLMQLILFVLYPCFILTKIPGNPSLAQPSVVVTSILAGGLLAVVGMAVCYLVGRVFKIRPSNGLNTFAVAAAIQNYGFLPIPLIEGIFPERSDQILGVLFVHNLGIEIALWTFGVVLISGKTAGAWRRLISGPTISITLGLFLNFTGLYVWIPGVVSTAMSELGKCSIPISLILVGATMAGVLQREKWVVNWRIITLSSLLRFAILPAFFFGVVWSGYLDSGTADGVAGSSLDASGDLPDCDC